MRVVSHMAMFDHGLTLLLRQKLHWLDATDCETFKLLVIVHQCLNGRAPQYLAVHCVSLSSQRHLCLTEQNLLQVPCRRLDTWPPGFCHC